MSLLPLNKHNIIEWIDFAAGLLSSVVINLLATGILDALPNNQFKIGMITIINISLIVILIIAAAKRNIYYAVALGITLGLFENLVADWFQSTLLLKGFTGIGMLGLLLVATVGFYIQEKKPCIARYMDDLFAQPSPLNRYPWYVRIILKRGIPRDIIAGLLSFSFFVIFNSFISLDGLYSLLSIIVMGAISALLSGRRSTACILPALISSISLCIAYEGISMSAIGSDAFFSIVSTVGALFFDALPKLWR